MGAATLLFSGWSTRFVDYDNDGWKDIFAAQGHVMDTIAKTSPNLSYLQPPLLLRNEAGRFSRVTPGEAFQRSWAGRGAAFGDLDNDGDVDIVVSNVGQPAFVLEERWRQPEALAVDPHGWQEVESRRHRLRREGRVGLGAHAVLHDQHRRRLSLGQRQTAARRSWRRRDGNTRGDSLAVRHRRRRFRNVKAAQTLVATEGQS